MPLGTWICKGKSVTPPIRSAARNYVAPCLPEDISRQSSTFSLARRAADLPRVKPNENVALPGAACCDRRAFLGHLTLDSVCARLIPGAEFHVVD
jgi:hypothetical protein